MNDIDAFLAQFRPHCGRPKELLLPRSLLDALPPLYSQENVADPLVHVKYFSPDAAWTWYASEAHVERDEDRNVVDVTFFGLVVGLEPELGYFSLDELAQVRGSLGLPVERDLFFTPVPLSRVREREKCLGRLTQ